MVDRCFTNHREAALALLGNCPKLPRKTGGFLGNVCVSPSISAAQRKWLKSLLINNGLPPLAEDNTP